jgi:hypothetical protein
VAVIQAAATREELGGNFIDAYGGDYGLHYSGGTGAREGSVMTMAQWRWKQEDG